MIKPIENFDGYFISDDGVVYCNLGKGNRRNDKTVDLYPIKPRLTKNGYARVYMRNTETNKREDRYVHRLVAQAFIPNPNNHRYVNHIDFVRDHNSADNLDWISAKENTLTTEIVGHVKRNEKGQYVSKFKYSK